MMATWWQLRGSKQGRLDLRTHENVYLVPGGIKEREREKWRVNLPKNAWITGTPKSWGEWEYTAQHQLNNCCGRGEGGPTNKAGQQEGQGQAVPCSHLRSSVSDQLWGSVSLLGKRAARGNIVCQGLAGLGWGQGSGQGCQATRETTTEGRDLKEQ